MKLLLQVLFPVVASTEKRETLRKKCPHSDADQNNSK